MVKNVTPVKKHENVVKRMIYQNPISEVIILLLVSSFLAMIIDGVLLYFNIITWEGVLSTMLWTFAMGLGGWAVILFFLRNWIGFKLQFLLALVVCAAIALSFYYGLEIGVYETIASIATTIVVTIFVFLTREMAD